MSRKKSVESRINYSNYLDIDINRGIKFFVMKYIQLCICK